MITLTPERVVKPGLAGGDRDGPQQLAVAEHLHLVGLRVDLVDVGAADVELHVAVLLAEDPGPGRNAVDVDVDAHVGAGSPVALRTPVDLVVAEPVPGAGLLGRGGDLEVLLDGRLVRDRDVERHDHGHADAHGLAVEWRHRGVGLLVEGQVDGREGGAQRLVGTVGAAGQGGHGVRRAGLEQPSGHPGHVVARHLPGHRAGGRGDGHLAQRAAVGLEGQPGVDGDVTRTLLDVGHQADRRDLGLRRLGLTRGRAARRARPGLRGGVRGLARAAPGERRHDDAGRSCREQAGTAHEHADGTPGTG